MVTYLRPICKRRPREWEVKWQGSLWFSKGGQDPRAGNRGEMQNRNETRLLSSGSSQTPDSFSVVLDCYHWEF